MKCSKCIYWETEYKEVLKYLKEKNFGKLGKCKIRDIEERLLNTENCHKWVYGILDRYCSTYEKK